MIQSGRNGFLVDFADIDGISTITSGLLHQDDYYSLRVAARETVIDQFNLERCLASQVNFLQSVLHSKEVIYAYESHCDVYYFGVICLWDYI